MLAQGHQALAMVAGLHALVDQLAHGQREEQSGRSGQHQEHQRHANAAPVRAQKGQQAGKGFGAGGLGGNLCHSLNGAAYPVISR